MSGERSEKATSDGIVIDGMYKGMPYVGPRLNIKHDDPPHMLPQPIAEVTVETFMMDNPADVEKYVKHMEDVGRGWAQISQEEVEWIPRRETW